MEPSFGYTGQYQDEESGLVYLRARYYDPLSQQFLSRDPLEGASGQPYAYAWGNPINYTDPAGLLPGDTQDKVPPRVGGAAPPWWTVTEQGNGTWVQRSLPGFWDLFRNTGQGVNAAGSDNAGSYAQGRLPGFEEILPRSTAYDPDGKGGTSALRDPATGEVLRTGRTKNLKTRRGQHASDEETKGLRFEIDFRTDNYDMQRAREQYIHELFGQPPLNKIRPIQPPRMAPYSSIIAIWKR